MGRELKIVVGEAHSQYTYHPNDQQFKLKISDNIPINMSKLTGDLSDTSPWACHVQSTLKSWHKLLNSLDSAAAKGFS